MLNSVQVKKNRLVPPNPLHKYYSKLLIQGGETVKQTKDFSEPNTDQPIRYDMQIKHGKTNICIVSPPPMTQEDTERVLEDYYAIAWSIIESIS